MSTEQSNSYRQKSGILTRFGYLLSAQGIEAGLSAAFFLYLAWLNSVLYGEIMYALAGSSIVMTIVEFGLYYPLVVDLAKAGPDETDRIVARVVILRMILLLPAILFIGIITYYRQFPWQTTLVFWLVCLGVALDAFAETFFAGLRVKALQQEEAKIRIIATIICYVFGFATAALMLPALIISLYRLIGAIIKIIYGMALNFKPFAIKLFTSISFSELKLVFANAAVFALIDILGSFYNKTNVFFLEKQAGMTGVAYYTATWNIIDGVSVMASSQFLGWVIFPLLATTFAEERSRLAPLVRNNALWLAAVAIPIMLTLYAESDFIIGLLYPKEYTDAAWMQRYLIWTIILSFQNNLFCYLMMVSGAGRVVLAFAIVVTVVNIVLNLILVHSLGLAGACLVIIFTKLFMTLLTFSFAQIRFMIFKIRDLIIVAILALIPTATYFILVQYINSHLALGSALVSYLLLIYGRALKLLGKLDGSISPENA